MLHGIAALAVGTAAASLLWLGMSPPLIGGGGVAGMLQPLAIALIGALLASIPLSCLVLPAFAARLARPGRAA